MGCRPWRNRQFPNQMDECGWPNAPPRFLRRRQLFRPPGHPQVDLFRNPFSFRRLEPLATLLKVAPQLVKTNNSLNWREKGEPWLAFGVLNPIFFEAGHFTPK